jgi:predicted transcriptional regulator
MGTGAVARAASGLGALRRRGAVTEILFLYDVTTREVPNLRGIAERLGVTVQAASHSFRQLRRQGLVEVRRGLYKPTVPGTAWLHSALGDLRRDVDRHLDRLPLARSARAVSVAPVRTGDEVSLSIVGGTLTARPGAQGPSHGRVAGPARAGELVLVTELQGIVPISPGQIRVVTIPAEAIRSPQTIPALRALLGARGAGLLVAQGGEAAHLSARASPRPVVRFGAAAASKEASAVGVDVTAVVLDEELPRFLEPFQGPDPPPLTVVRLPLGPVRRSRQRAK